MADTEEVRSIFLCLSPEKEKFEKLLRGVDREGIDKLIDWLEETDFFSAPASTRFHLARMGGLLTHSLNVFYWFLEKNERLKLGFPLDSLILVSLLHDLCKIDTYIPYGCGSVYGFKKHEGHGNRSITLASEFLVLTADEVSLIRFHMGTFSEENSLGRYHIAVAQNPLIAVFAVTDHEVSLMEKNAEKGDKIGCVE